MNFFKAVRVAVGTLSIAGALASVAYAAQAAPAAVTVRAQARAISKASAAAGPPTVRECACLGPSSPTRYVCGGKVYTSYQLTRIREAAAKK